MKDVWFVMSFRDNSEELEFSHDFGGEFYFSYEEASNRVRDLGSGVDDKTHFLVLPGKVEIKVIRWKE